MKTRTKAFLVALFFAAIYWVLESLVHWYFTAQVLASFLAYDPHERYMRGTATLLIFFATFFFWIVKAQAISRSRHVWAFQQAFNQLSEGVIISNTENRIIYANQSVTDITGYAESELVGQNPNVLSSGKQGPGFYKSLWSELTQKGRWEGEIWNRRQDGEVYPEWLSITAFNEDPTNTYYVAIFTDITLRKKSEALIERYAYEDPLTGLYNRRHFLHQLNLLMKSSQRDEKMLMLLYIDLNKFKAMNDTHGHAFGDSYLCAFSQHLQSTVRETDIVARFGGDEFAILLSGIPGTNDCEDLLKRIALKTSTTIEGREVVYSASIGVALYPQDASTPDELLAEADKAMYVAKSHAIADGHTVRYYSDGV